jgi:galactose mutarotase-like enzyme
LTAASVRVRHQHGAAAVTLRAGDLEATFLPELNLLGTSLLVAGEEFLALPGGVAAYRRGHTTGLPLLAPWANRLGGRTYRSGRTRVSLDGLSLHVDGNGLPIHGTLSAHDAWDVTRLSTSGRRATLEARLDFDRPEQLAAFPFPHRLEVTSTVDGRVLTVGTVLRPTGDRAVPVAFGYHPYFRLPGGRRERWRLRLPGRVALELDDRGLPTGGRTPARSEGRPIGDRTFDDLFELTAGGRTLQLESRHHRLIIQYGRGYGFGQVFAPPGESFVALEPMTAPTNALVTGSCAVVPPGETFTARFTIRPEMRGR